MPVNVTPLDQSSFYIYCETCAANGNARSIMRREMDTVQCSLGHKMSSAASMTVRPFSGDLPDTSHMSMVKASELFLEQPNITDMMWKVPVNPKVKAKLEQKFAGRIFATIGTLLAALSDDKLVMITGEEAAELRKLGIKNGSEMLSAMKHSKETERELQSANDQLEKFIMLLKAAGVGSGL